MAAVRDMLTVLALGSALIARPAHSQVGASVSLTHTVTVTVPPRVKVQLGGEVVSQAAAIAASQPGVSGLSVSVAATQSWRLLIGAANERSELQWSSNRDGGFRDVGSRETTIATGDISPVPSASTVFFRSANALGGADLSSGDETVVLTVVAP